MDLSSDFTSICVINFIINLYLVLLIGLGRANFLKIFG
jgi:hypothetical protein